ncbi:MAG: hypothetical protein GF350_15870 [Chitinivibrionales bacterium]|nr:hypothetical protein [Chitinivibrionales bacterium]
MLFSEGIVQKSVDSIPWQDYRASKTGMICMYSSDPVSEIPIREVPEEYPSLDILPEPNYETGTYGFYGCIRNKARSAFVKSKFRYLFFMTKYAGTNQEYQEKLLVTGYYRIAKTADVNKLHMRYITDSSCINADSCTALRADEVHFVSCEDAYEITDEILESWGHKSKITRQTRIALDEEKTKMLLEYLSSKEDALAQYVAETRRLEPAGEEEDDELELEDADEEMLATDGDDGEDDQVYDDRSNSESSDNETAPESMRNTQSAGSGN